MSAAARLAAVLCILVLVVSPGVRAAEADKAREAFESLYGSDVKRAKASREATDDLDLAKRLLAAAKEATGQPEFLSVLCEQAADLAADHPEGAATAVEAVEFLASSVPEKAGACTERVIDIRQKQFDRARGDAKTEAGEALVDALLSAADGKLAGADPTEAANLCRRAQTVGRAVKSDRLEEIDARLKGMVYSLRAAREAESLKAQLARSADDAAAREKLVRLLLVDLDNPAEAAKFVAGVAEESLLKYVPAAAKGIEAASEPACADLGEWYRTLGEAAPAPAKAAMFTRAKDYYERFLDLHAAEDLDRTKVSLALRKVEAELKRLAPKPATGGWQWLFNGKDLSAWGPEPATWQVERGVMTAKKGAGFIWTKEKFGDFTLELDFLLTKDGNSGIYVRVGDVSRPIQLSFEVQLFDATGTAVGPKQVCGALYGCLAPTRVASRPPGQWNHIAVTCKGSRMMVVLNGEKVIDTDLAQWSVPGRNPDGSSNPLAVAYKDMARQGAIALQAHTNVVGFRNVRIRRLDG